MTALLWGTLLSIVVQAFKLAFKGQLSVDLLLDRILNGAFLITWVKYIAGAFVFSWLMWFLSLKKYRELKRKQGIQQELHLPH